NLAKALLNFDSTQAISLLNDLISQGKEVKKITLNLIEFFRDALMYTNIKKVDESSLLFTNQDFQNLANNISNRKAFYIIDVLNKALNEINWSNNPKIHLELAFLKISDSEDNSNSNVLAAIDEIEKRILELENFKENTERYDQVEKKEIIENIISNKKDEEPEEEQNEVEIDDTETLFTEPQEKTTSYKEYQEIKQEQGFAEDNSKDNIEEIPSVLADQEEISKFDSQTSENTDEEEPLEKEELSEELSVERVEQESENNQEEAHSSETIKSDLCKDASNTYDIRFVEEVLNNGDRQDKLFLQSKWSNFPALDNEEDSNYLATLLETGTVVASANDKIIITFSSTTICNTMMTPYNKETVIKIINKKLNRIINYMALPTNVFNDISTEFLERYRMGEKYIKLSKIVCDGLKDVSQEELQTNGETKPRIIQDAIDLFGDKVIIKE
ncbi:MAG: hypothetical protein WCY80_04145, partial [Candidatus Izemoplasmatales bacterium]